MVQRPQRRGAEMFAVQLGAELRRQGHAARAAFLYPAPAEARLNEGPEDVVLNGRENHPAERFAGFQWSLVRSLRRLTGDFRPDVVQAGGGRTVKYAALASGRTRRRPGILVWRNIGQASDWATGWWRRLFYRRLVLPRVDGVVSVTRASQRDFEALYAPRVPITTIPNAVDRRSVLPTRRRTRVRQELGTPAGAPVVLFVGNLGTEKRPDRWIRVFRKVQHELPEARGWIVGDGPLRDRLEDRLGLDDIRLLGSRDDVGDIMAAADVLLLTSDTEGTPGVLIEAGLVGLAVVATDVGGVAELVEDGDTGILRPRADEDGLAAAVVRLIREPQLRSTLADSARVRTERQYTMEKVTRRYLEFYRQLLEP